MYDGPKGGYYTPEYIDRVVEATDFLSLLSEYTRVKRSGKRYVALCPFHREKTPSFSIDVDKGLFYCFGCGKGGNLLTFVMEKENLSFPEAVAYLARKAGIPLPRKGKAQSDTATIEKINQLAHNYYKKNLFSAKGKAALEYLKSRGLTTEEIKELELGFAVDEYQGFVKIAQKEGWKENLLIKAGLAIKKTELIDRFRNRIMFPIFTPSGRLCGFGGRILEEKAKTAKYLNTPETPLYHKGGLLYGLNTAKKAIQKEDKAILVEGYMDCISLWKEEIRNVVASSGTALTSRQASILKRYTDKVVIAYDGDRAGFTAAMRALPILLAENLIVYILKLEEDDDPDSYIKREGKQAFLKLLNESPDWYNYLMNFLEQKLDSRRPDHKLIFIKKLAPFISAITDRTMRELYLSAMADKLALSPQLVAERIDQETDKRKPLAMETPKGEQLKKEQQIELELFAQLAVSFDEDLMDWLKGLLPYFNYYPGLFEQVLDKLEAGERVDKNFIFSLFQDSQSRAYITTCILNKEDLPSIKKCGDLLRRLNLKRRLAELRAGIERAEKEGDKKSFRNYTKEMQKVITQLRSE